MKHKILAIDDCPLDLEGIEFLLESNGFHVKATVDSEEGIAFIRQNRGAVSLAIVDHNMPGNNGAKVAEILKQLDPRLQIATYSGMSSPDVYDALAVGSQYFIQKGIEPEKLLAIVKMFCTRYEELHKTVVVEPITDAAVRKVNSLGITGRSQHLVEVAHLAHTYGPQDETILITGENGTGKEKIARAIHALSGRRGPFIPVNCGAIPGELMESELFGHEKGAFSGAVRDKIGLVQAANNGSIFLDEIGDLPLQLQVKLLRFLQESEVRPVGSNNTTKVNTRVIVATNVDLEAAVPTGRFRQDLYYRIKGFPIHLKPLRERRDDIKPLVIRFSQIVSAEKEIKKEFLEETVKLLTRYDWPGNVRELEHEVKRAMMLATGPAVAPSDIHESIRDAVERAEKQGLIDSDIDYEAFKDQQRLRAENEEKKFLIDKSKRAKSIRELARDVLKISNSTLQGRLKSLGIEFKTTTEKEDPKGEMDYETT
jgi:DNA-binding NtrC family response regulator